MALIGMLPQSAYGQMGTSSAPMTAQPAPEAFQWGEGGSRLTPEDIARKRQQALALQKAGMDYSPVQHWTQGLSRVAQALMGGYDEQQADKASKSNDAHSNEVLTALMGGGGPNVAGGATPGAAGMTPGYGDNSGLLVSAMTDPYIDPSVRQLAQQQYQWANKPVNNDTVADYNFWQQTLTPDEFATWKQNKINPPRYVQGPDGQFYPVNASPTPQAAPQVLGTDLPQGWKLEGGPASQAPGGF